MHITPVRVKGVLDGYQLCVGGGGPGNTKFFAVKKRGGAVKARSAAKRLADSLGLPKTAKRGGSVAGRLLKTSKTGESGIRFDWVNNASGPALTIVGTWVDKGGQARERKRSVERHGLEGALDQIIALRVSAGAPKPDRDALLKQLRKVYRTGAAA